MIRFSDYEQYLAPALAKTTGLTVVRGEGSFLWDDTGRRYIDWVQGIAVNALGHCHPKVVAAIQEQVGKLLTASFNMVSYESTLRWAKAIADVAPGELGATFFSNGGAEAVDGALKLARAATGRPGVVAFIGSFHGRTLGATSVTASSAKYRKGYDPLVGGVETTAYPSPGQCPPGVDVTEYAWFRLQELFAHVRDPETVAAIVMEPVQGEGGYIVPPVEFVTRLRDLCDEHGILLVFDEIQSGWGRTGKFFASEHFGVVPDIMTVGKAMAGGLPASGIVSTPQIMERWGPGRHGTTFGGNPVVAAAGLAVLEEYAATDLLANVVEQGRHLAERTSRYVAEYPIVTDARGLGLMRAIELNHPDGRPGADLLEQVRRQCLEDGLLTLACGVKGNGLRFATPLNVTADVLDEGLAILEGALAKVSEAVA
ncbi:MAG: aspartate aminotransferase family protein [Propionibacteriaceae bacterium]|jgi:4-aminobutyrate aminotransferase|nr:aspartate aminotransferase family protein [Propionibacteriaceae bacterium]